MNRTHQMKCYRFTGGHNIVAPSDGFQYDIPWMAPHVSGRVLDAAILQYQMGYKVDAAHKVTPSRNKREGWYSHKARETLRQTLVDDFPAKWRVIGIGPVRFRRGAARIDSRAKFRRAGG